MKYFDKSLRFSTPMRIHKSPSLMFLNSSQSFLLFLILIFLNILGLPLLLVVKMLLRLALLAQRLNCQLKLLELELLNHQLSLVPACWQACTRNYLGIINTSSIFLSNIFLTRLMMIFFMPLLLSRMFSAASRLFSEGIEGTLPWNRIRRESLITSLSNILTLAAWEPRHPSNPRLPGPGTGDIWILLLSKKISYYFQ